MKISKRIFLVGLLLAFLALVAPALRAQPYYTNTITGNPGAVQFNDNLARPYQPSVLFGRQYNAGIQAGKFTVTNTTCVVTFGTNIYSVAPVVTANTTSATNAVGVSSVTTSNVTLELTYNAGVIYWQAIGN
jgi:hypothetical protein